MVITIIPKITLTKMLSDRSSHANAGVAAAPSEKEEEKQVDIRGGRTPEQGEYR